MIRLGICEDVYEELVHQKEMIERIMAHMSQNVKVYCFQSSEDLLFEIDESGNMDIILLDIILLGMNGLDFARKLREKDDRAILIFISSYDQYCKELIDVQPYAFIDKPISNEKLEKVLTRAIVTRLNHHESYSFSNRKTQYNIPLAEIRYFQSDKRRIYVNTTRKSTLESQYAFYDKLQKVEEAVSRSDVKFLRVRKSFLVNAQYITEYAAERVVLDDGTVIEISKNYKETVREFYMILLKEKE